MTKEKKTDNELIEEILAGKIEKFAELVERYERLVFSFLLARLKNYQEVEDIAQDAFVKAFKHLNSFDGEHKFSSWLVTIAKNLLIDSVRKNSRSIASDEMVTDFLANKSAKNDSNQPHVIVAKKESFNRIIKMIYELPQNLCEPFLFRVINEMSYDDIAEALELPLQTVKNRIFKARNLLREKRDKS